MGSAWEPGWEGRIAKFASERGFENIWEYLRAHPEGTLVTVAKEIGDVAAVQIGQMVIEHCRRIGAMEELVLNLLCREIRAAVPKGWGSGSDFKVVMAFSSVGSAVGVPWDDVVSNMLEVLRQEGRTPAGWFPANSFDPLLLEAMAVSKERLGPEAMARTPSPEPGDRAWAAIEPFWGAVDIYGSPDDFRETSRVVPERVGLLLAIRWLDSEVRNGGFHQFFQNSTGVLAPEALEGLLALGAQETAMVVSEAVARFGSSYPRDRERRLSSLRELEREGDERSEWDPFFELDQIYYEVSDREGLHERADRFAPEVD